MLDTFKMRTTDLPDEMRLLLNSYPRDTWDDHPGFKDKTRQWLSAHRGFRFLAEKVNDCAETYLDRNEEGDRFARQLSYYGGILVGNLHGHHGWEDRHYFPELSAADPRLDAGLELLEQDHADLDAVLDRFVDVSNRTIKLMQLDEKQAREEAAGVLESAAAIANFLERHLGDEEDLAVPIILHHRLRG